MLSAFYSNNASPPDEWIDVPSLSQLPTSTSTSTSSPSRAVQGYLRSSPNLVQRQSEHVGGVGEGIGVRTPMNATVIPEHNDKVENNHMEVQSEVNEKNSFQSADSNKPANEVLPGIITTSATSVEPVVPSLSTENVPAESVVGTIKPLSNTRKEKWPPLLKTKSLVNIKAIFVVISWMVILGFGLVYSSIVRWVCTCLIALCASFRVVGGFDELELLLHADLMTHEHTAPVSRFYRSKGKSDHDLSRY